MMDRPVSLLEMWKVRQETIEECARAVKDYGEENILSYGMDGLLAAIRALKDKRP